MIATTRSFYAMKSMLVGLAGVCLAVANFSQSAELVMPPPEFAKEVEASPKAANSLNPINDQVWDFHISSIQAETPSDNDIEECFNAEPRPRDLPPIEAQRPRRVLKWKIVTQLRNVSDTNLRLTKVLNFWGTPSGVIPIPYMGNDSFEISPRSLDDFQVLKPGQVLETLHTVYAVEAADHRGYWLRGSSKRNGHPWRAYLKVSGDFLFAMTLHNYDDFQWGTAITPPRVKWLWEGRIRTPPAVLTTAATERIALPQSPDARDHARRSHFKGSYSPSFNDELLQRRWNEALADVKIAAKDLVAAWNGTVVPTVQRYMEPPSPVEEQAGRVLREKLESMWRGVLQDLRSPQGLEGSAIWTARKTWEAPELRFAWQDLHRRSYDQTVTGGQQEWRAKIHFDVFRKLSIENRLDITPSQETLSGSVWEEVSVGVRFMPVLPKAAKNFGAMVLSVSYVNRAPKRAEVLLTRPGDRVGKGKRE